MTYKTILNSLNRMQSTIKRAFAETNPKLKAAEWEKVKNCAVNLIELHRKTLETALEASDKGLLTSGITIGTEVFRTGTEISTVQDKINKMMNELNTYKGMK